MTARRLAFLSWVAWVGSTPLACPLDSPPPPAPRPVHLAAALVAEAPPGRAGYVVDVHDGDTARIRTEDDEQITVRLLGIDAPELMQGEPGRMARNWLVGRVAGVPVRVEADSHGPRDPYGRTLAWIYLCDKCINVEMVRAGMAFAWRPAHHGRLDRWDAVVGAEREARAAHAGVWAAGAGVEPPWIFRKEGRRGRSSP